MKTALLLFTAVVAFACPVPLRADAPRVEISRKSEALLPIVISEQASDGTRKLAQEFARHLGQITGGVFKVETSKEPRGILLGTDTEWPGVLNAAPEGRSPVLIREDYRLMSGVDGVFLVGRTPLALENAIWDFFYGIGFRHYFPGSHWEIWPETPDLAVSIDASESPDYSTRRIFFGGGLWNVPSRNAFQQWEKRNRMVSGFKLETQHAYGDLIRRNQAHFTAHPEDVLSNGKLDTSRPTVLAIAAEEALRQFEKDPTKDCVSMDPSDGGGWRKDSPLGTPSNQALTLANHVAASIQERFPGRKVGMYAYNEHSPAPQIRVDPNVIISVTTHFLTGGTTVEELMKGWRAQGATELGIREYLSVWAWERDLPGRSLAANPAALGDSIARFHQLGARYWIAEGSNSWLPNGLGYWIASRVLWDTSESERIPALLDDFYQRSFGNAGAEMRLFCERYLLAEGKPLLSEDLVGRMYRSLKTALPQANSPLVSRRIFDFVVYTRFVDLYLTYRNSDGDARQSAYEELARFAWQARDFNTVNVRAIFGLPERDKKLKPLAEWQTPEGTHPLKAAGVIEVATLASLIDERIAATKLNDFVPLAFSSDLVPVAGAASADELVKPVELRGVNRIHLYSGKAESQFEFEVTGGLIYGSRGPVRLRLFSPQHALVNEPVAEVDVAPDKAAHHVQLKSPYGGLHYLDVDDGNDKTRLSWRKDQTATFSISPEEKTQFEGRYNLTFFVPRGSKVVGGYSDSPRGKVMRPDGTVVFDFASMKGAGYFSIPVHSGEDGVWWRFAEVTGEKLLLTVPPYVARQPSELILPKEVILEKESR